MKGFDTSVLCFEETEKFGAFEGKVVSMTISILWRGQMIHSLRRDKSLPATSLFHALVNEEIGGERSDIHLNL